MSGPPHALGLAGCAPSAGARGPERRGGGVARGRTVGASPLAAFDRVRIINLARRSDRHRECLAELARLGARVDGSHIAFHRAREADHAAGFPNAAVRACFLSHLAVIEDAVAEGVARLLVLEDDFTFSRRMGPPGRPHLQALEQHDWQLAYLGHGRPAVRNGPLWLPVRGPVPQAHCYALRGEALVALRDHLRAILSRPPGHPDGGPMHYDGALSRFANTLAPGRAFHAAHSLCYPRPSRTDLHTPSALDTHPLLIPLAPAFRTVKRLCLRVLR